MIQKIIKVGNSAAITLPHSFVKDMNWQPGEHVFLTTDTDSGTLTIQKKSTKVKKQSPITPEFVEWLDAFNKKHTKSLTELAGK